MQFDPAVAALFAAAQAANLPAIDHLDVEPGRALYKAQIAHTGAPRVEMESVRDLDAKPRVDRTRWSSGCSAPTAKTDVGRTS